MSEFDRCLPRILVTEGGYTNNKNDPGGATNKGIIQRVFGEWLTSQGKPMRDVRTITDAEVAAIYRQRYWDVAQLDKLPVGVSYVVFDGNVNSGVSQSVKWLQRALQAIGLYQGAIDGVIGQGTILAAGGCNDNDALIAAIEAKRLAFMKALKTWKYFGKGWSARVAAVLATGQAWATGSVGPDPTYHGDEATAKALISDAKASPVIAVSDHATGAGVSTVAVSGYIDHVKDQISAFSGSIDFVNTALFYLTVAGLTVAAGGAAYSWYARHVRAKRADVLDLATTGQVSPPTVAAS